MYLNVPTDELANRLQRGEVANLKTKAIPDEKPSEITSGFELLSQYAADIHEKPVHALAEELAVEWTRLFRGLKRGYGPPPPYESVYGGTERTMGPAAIDVSRIYAEAGAGLSKELHQLPDYIGVELDSMRFMCAKEAEAWSQGKVEDARRMLQLEGTLLKDHLAAWIPKFCDTAMEEAKNEFYTAVLKITKGVVISETDQVDDLIATANSAQAT